MLVESASPKYQPHEGAKGVLELENWLKESIENPIAQLGRGNLPS